MQLKNIISLWVLSALLIAQLAVAGHSAAHPDHGFETAGISQSHTDTDHNKRGHDCPECLLSKSLQAALYSEGIVVISLELRATDLSLPEHYSVSSESLKPYRSRAPPRFLI